VPESNPVEEVELPLQVASNEYLERAVASGNVTAKGTLKWQALKLRDGEPGASIIRQVIGDNRVKVTARDVKSRYCGLAESRAMELRDAGLGVVDRRRPGEYHGHAEIEFATYPMPLEPYEPLEASEGNLKDVNYYRSCLKLFTYFPDSDPHSDTWGGPPLGASAE